MIESQDVVIEREDNPMLLKIIIIIRQRKLLDSVYYTVIFNKLNKIVQAVLSKML